MTIRAYTRISAVVFIGLGLAGFFALFDYPGFFGPGAAENLMHLIVGLFFGVLGFSSAEASILRTFVGSMGVLLLLGKAVLIGANLWGGESVEVAARGRPFQRGFPARDGAGRPGVFRSSQ